MTDHSDAALVERYLQLRDYIAEVNDKHEQAIKPYVEGMEAIEAEFLKRLNERVPDQHSKANSATDFGTAFRVRRMTSKVVDQNAFLKWCFDRWHDSGSTMLRVQPVAEPLKEWLEHNIDPTTKEQKFPDGLEISHRMTVNIRKA